MQATGDVSDEEAQPKSHYLNMGVVSELASETVRKKPELLDCLGMTPGSEKHAMNDYMLEKKAYQRDKKAATDALRRARRVKAGGRVVKWATIEYSGDNTPTLHPRDLVKLCCLSAGQNIIDRRLYEEAVLQGLEWGQIPGSCDSEQKIWVGVQGGKYLLW